MDDIENKNYQFKLLRDEVEVDDLFEGKTHDKVAESILELLKNEDGGITKFFQFHN